MGTEGPPVAEEPTGRDNEAANAAAAEAAAGERLASKAEAAARTEGDRCDPWEEAGEGKGAWARGAPPKSGEESSASSAAASAARRPSSTGATGAPVATEEHGNGGPTPGDTPVTRGRTGAPDGRSEGSAGLATGAAAGSTPAAADTAAAAAAVRGIGEGGVTPRGAAGAPADLVTDSHTRVLFTQTSTRTSL